MPNVIYFMNPSQQNLKQLLDFYQAGKIFDAEKKALFLSVNFPQHPFSWKVLGAIYAQTNRKKECLEANLKVVALSPNDAEAYNNLANIQKDFGYFIEAISNYEKAISLNPNYPEAFNNLAVCLQENKQLEEAKINYQKAISLNSNYIQAYNNLGVLLKDLGKLDDAIICFKRVIKIKPNYPTAFNNLGVVLQDIGDFENAIKNFNQAIFLNPNYAEAYNNLGNCLKDTGKFTEAIKNINKAISIRPKYYQAYNNLGTTLRNSGKFQDAKQYYKKAIALKPDYAEAYNNLGVVLKDLNEFAEAESAYQNAIKIKPDYPEAFYNLGFTYIKQHKFEEGYKLLEWRWKTVKRIGNKFSSLKPIWSGEPNKKVLLWKEQGIGDEIMFGSIIKELFLLSKSLVVYCDKRLIPLFQRSLPKKINFISEPKQIESDSYDFHIAMGSLPYFFRKKLDSFKEAAKGYLISDSKKTENLRLKLTGGLNQKIVGISWHTKSINNLSSFRNIKLHQMVMMLNNFNVTIVNLQYGDTTNEINSVKSELGIDIINIEEIDNLYDLDGLSSLISACDFVVSTTNVTVHLSACLGKDTRVLLPINPDARWAFKGQYSYWYDSVKLYRQVNLGDWNEPLNQLRNDIKILLKK